MKINQNKVVVLSYAAKVDGMIVDQMTEEKPLDYIQGNNMLLPKLEEALEGKEEGFEFDLILQPEDAYGIYDEARVVEIPKDAFVVNGQLHEEILRIGNMIPMYNGEGQIVHGRVTELKESVVVMDFNHPMAGKTLSFTGKVISVREATEKELTEGLHGEFVPQGDGCSCGGGCNGGCGGGCNGGCGGGCGDGGCGGGCGDGGCGGGCHS